MINWRKYSEENPSENCWCFCVLIEGNKKWVQKTHYTAIVKTFNFDDSKIAFWIPEEDLLATLPTKE